MKPLTVKLLFIDPSKVQLDALVHGIKALPIILVFQEGLESSYIVDTGIQVKGQ